MLDYMNNILYFATQSIIDSIAKAKSKVGLSGANLCNKLFYNVNQ